MCRKRGNTYSITCVYIHIYVHPGLTTVENESNRFNESLEYRSLHNRPPALLPLPRDCRLPQTPPMYRKPTERDYHDGDRGMYMREAERGMYDERERAYHDGPPDHPPPPHPHPHPNHHSPSHRGRSGYPGAEPVYREVRDRFFTVPRNAYPNPEGIYRSPRDGYPQRQPMPPYGERQGPRRGGGGEFLEPKHECADDMDKHYDAEPESPYPEYVPMGRGSRGPRGDPPAAVDMPKPGDPPRRHSPPKLAQAPRGRGRSPEAVSSSAAAAAAATAAAAAAAAAAGVVQTRHPLYKPGRHGVGSVPAPMSQSDAGGVGGGGGGNYQARGNGSSAGGSPILQARRGSEDVSPARGVGRPRGGSAAPPPPLPQQQLPREAPSAISRPGLSTIARAGGSSGNGIGAIGISGSADDAAPRRGSKSAVHSPQELSGKAAGSSRDDGGRGGSGSGSGGKPFCEVVQDASGVTRLFIPETPPVVPRRPPSKGNKRETLGDIAHRIPVSVMRPYFNYPLRTAAEVRTTFFFFDGLYIALAWIRKEVCVFFSMMWCYSSRYSYSSL